MRFSTMILGLCAAGITAASALAGCGGSDGGNGGGGGTNMSSSSSSGSSGTMSSSSGSSGSCTAACCPTASCKATDKTCIGLVDNAGKTKFGLRMSELDVTKPAALTSGIVASVVAGNVLPANAGCNLNGTGTFSWLLQFDTTAGTLKTGGAKPVADETKGYDFVDDMVMQGNQTFHIQPITFTGVTPDANGAFSVTMGTDLYVPIYLDPGATQVVILPLKEARLAMGTLSSNNNCIGAYNANGLDPANTCLADSKNHTFITGGSLDGLITLEDADTVLVSSLMQSLCVLLSGNASMYGQKASDGITYCKRDSSNKILFQGDTCSMAGQTCTDSVKLTADFAASSVQINN